MLATRDRHDEIDRDRAIDEWEEALVLVVRGGDGVADHALLTGEHLDDRHRRHSGEGIEAVARELDAHRRKRGAPRLVVRGHGVDERAVAVEDQRLVLRGNDIEGAVHTGSLARGEQRVDDG